MGSWARAYVPAFAICLAALVSPRSVWDRARLALLGAAEAAGTPARAGSDGGGGGGDAGAAADPETLRLRAEILRLESIRADLERALAQATALREAAPAVKAESVVAARALGGPEAAVRAASGGPKRGGRLRIDVGRRGGVVEGLAVTDGARLIGRIAAANSEVAEVELLSAPGVRVRCRDARTGEEGILRGAPDGLLRFRPAGGGEAAGASFGGGGAAPPDVREGDPILTSAWSAFAPPDLVIGTVEAVVRAPDSGLVEAIVRPAGALAGLERVLVIRPRLGSGRPAGPGSP